MPEPRMSEDQLYALQTAFENEENQGGGGRKGKGEKTGKAISESQAVNTRMRLEKEYRYKIEKVVRGVLKQDEGLEDMRHLEVYKGWLIRSLRGGETVNVNEIEENRTLAHVHAGGQGAQKNESAVILTHKPSLIYAREEQSRSSYDNKLEARKRLERKLGEHVKHWQFLLERVKQEDVEKLIDEELIKYI